MERGIALSATKADIAQRLRRVCENFDEQEFAKLVDQMAEIDVRYRLRDDFMYYHRARHGGTPSMN